MTESGSQPAVDTRETSVSPAPNGSEATSGPASAPLRPHSRVTGIIRLLTAVWLIVAAVRSLSSPEQAAGEQGLPLGTLLPLAGLDFTLGVFMLTGFMSRVTGVILIVLGGWQVLSYGAAALPVVLVLVGVYLMLRGGGAWAMDIYVQKVQDRARRKAAAAAAALSSPESS